MQQDNFKMHSFSGVERMLFLQTLPSLYLICMESKQKVPITSRYQWVWKSRGILWQKGCCQFSTWLSGNTEKSNATWKQCWSMAVYKVFAYPFSWPHHYLYPCSLCVCTTLEVLQSHVYNSYESRKTKGYSRLRLCITRSRSNPPTWGIIASRQHKSGSFYPWESTAPCEHLSLSSGAAHQLCPNRGQLPADFSPIFFPIFF